jgi:hypothetical protein
MIPDYFIFVLFFYLESMLKERCLRGGTRGRNYTVEPGVEIIRWNQGKQSLHKVPELKLGLVCFYIFNE